MLIDNHAIAQGEARRAQIEAATQEFLRSGKQVEIVEPQTVKPKPITPALFNNSTSAEADAKSRARGNRKSAAVNSLPLRKRGTPQAKQNDMLRQEWP